MLVALEAILYVAIPVGIIWVLKSPRWKADRRISHNGLDYKKMNHDFYVEEMSDREVALKQLRGEYDK